MTGCAWMIGVTLLAQVGTAGGRYQSQGNTNPFGPTAQSNSGTSASQTGSGLVPVNEPSASGGTAQPLASPGSRTASPFSVSGASPLGSTSPYSPPPAGSGPTTSAAGTYPWQTTGGTQSGVADSQKPSSLMRAMLVAPTGSRLSGMPISLADAVATAASREDQTQRVEAYWDLCSSVADYYLGVHEQQELQRLRNRVQRVDSTWQQAEGEMAVRVGTAQSAAVASQYKLASLMGLGGALPLPADTPHCGDYHTRYNEIFAGRSSSEADELAKLIPQRYAELKAAAQAVTRSEQELEATASRSDGVDTLRALELLALRRRAFVQIARDYNRRIARYTELSTPGQVAASRLIGMLIKSSASSTATRTAAPIPSNRQSQTAPSLPRTFDEGWTPASGEKVEGAVVDASVKPAAGEVDADEPPREERSLLVNPRQGSL